MQSLCLFLAALHTFPLPLSYSISCSVAANQATRSNTDAVKSVLHSWPSPSFWGLSTILWWIGMAVLVWKSLHAVLTLSLWTVLYRIVVQTLAKPKREDSQDQGKGNGRGRVKRNNSHEICVESRLTASLITNSYFGEETKPRLFLLRILLLVIHFCSALQSTEPNTDT